MSLRHRAATITFTLTLTLVQALAPAGAQALALGDLLKICRQSGKPCAELPLAQAYVGGALDMVAMLDEETEYLGTLYCRSPQVLFDVPKIIAHLERLGPKWQARNAMLGVINYLEQEGDCSQ